MSNKCVMSKKYTEKMENGRMRAFTPESQTKLGKYSSLILSAQMWFWSWVITAGKLKH